MTGHAPHVVTDGQPSHLATTRLTVDLDALVSNWRSLASQTLPATTAAVVKADAYGLGTAPVVEALSNAGCSHFFVAWPEEGLRLRKLLPKSECFVFGGLTERSFPVYLEANLIPVLNTLDEIKLWSTELTSRGVRRPCAIHVDTGMNRLGLSLEDAEAFARENARNHTVIPILIISHLACADTPEHPLNQQQLSRFAQVQAMFPDTDLSLANSAGVFCGDAYKFDLTRPGIALYGGSPLASQNKSLLPVATLQSRIVQIRHVPAGQSVGYGAAQSADKDMHIAICGTGYADGYSRNRQKGSAYLHNTHIPIVGRISMDMIAVDVSEVDAKTGDWVELFGNNILLDSVAELAGTIGYEILTSIGQRCHRRYISTQVI